MTQPNLIETIEKALEAATPGPWYAIRTEIFVEDGPIAKLWGEGPKGKFDFDNYESNAHLIANAPEWLRALLEENAKLQQKLKDFEGCKGVEDYYRVLSELRQVKVERDTYKNQRNKALTDWGSTLDTSQNFIEIVESLNTELSAKNKVLEWYADYQNYIGMVDGSSNLHVDGGLQAKYIITQYPPRREEP